MNHCRWLLAPALALLLGACTEEAPTPPPAYAADHIYMNGVVYTVDAARSVVQAVGIQKDRIIYVGSNEGAESLIGADTAVHDMQGNMMLPGLIDIHIHPMDIIERRSCNLENQPMSLAEMVPVLQQCEEDYALVDGWLLVDQWNFAVGNQPSAEYPTLRAALDAVSTEVPVILGGSDGHHAAFNSAALARARTADGTVVGLTKQTLAAHFSGYAQYIGVDGNGEPGGAVSETARELMDPPPMYGYERMDPARMPEVAQALAASGLTTVQDADAHPDGLPLYEQLADSGAMTFRLNVAMRPDFDDYADPDSGRIDVAAIVDDLAALREHFEGHPLIKAEAAKIYVDGVLEGNPLAEPPTLPNAAVLAHYRQPRFHVDVENEVLEITGYVDTGSDTCRAVHDDPGAYEDTARRRGFYAANGYLPAQCMTNNGVLEEDPDFIRAYMAALQEREFVIHSHAIGDRAVRVALDNYAALKEEYGDHGLPHAIAHAQLVHPDDQLRMGDLGVFLAFTYAWIIPDFFYDMSVTPFIDEVAGNDDLYNPDHYVMQNAYPARSIFNAGGILAAGSDAPIDTRDPRPFINMAQAVFRSNADGQVFNANERIDIHQAIAAYTFNGARALRRDAEIGSIEIGKKADFVIIDRNILQLAARNRPAQLRETRVVKTIFDGEVVFEAKGGN